MARVVLSILLLLVIAILSTTVTLANAQVITLSPMTETPSNTINLQISFQNNTNATLTNESITEAQGNAIITAIDTLLESPDDELDPTLEEQLEELRELEEITEEQEPDSDSDNGNGGNGDNDDNDNGNGDNNNDDEPEPPIIEEPEPPIEPPIGGGTTELKLDPCSAIYLTMVGAPGPPEECIEKYREAAEEKASKL